MELSSSNSFTFDYIILMIIGSISCFIYLILFIMYFKRKKQFDIIAIINLQLIISCALNSISFIIPNKSSDKVTIQCQIQIIFSVFSELSTYCIVFIIALTSLLNFSYKEVLERNKHIFYLIISLFCWVIPIVCGIIPSILNQIKNSDGICLIDDNLTNEVYVVYGFVFILHTINLIALLLLIKKIKDFLNQENLVILYHKYYKRLLRYLILLGISFCLMIFSLIIVYLSHQKIIIQSTYILNFITNFIEATLCPFYAIVYGVNMEDWRDLMKMFSCEKKVIVEIPNPISGIDDSFNLSQYDSLGYS